MVGGNGGVVGGVVGGNGGVVGGDGVVGGSLDRVKEEGADKGRLNENKEKLDGGRSRFGGLKMSKRTKRVLVGVLLVSAGAVVVGDYGLGRVVDWYLSFLSRG